MAQSLCLESRPDGCFDGGKNDQASKMEDLDDEGFQLEDDFPELSREEEFFEAVQKNDLDGATLMAGDPRIQINTVNCTHKTPLYLALENENMPMVKMLLNRGADVDLSSYCSSYCLFETPLVTAARLERLDFVEMLLDCNCVLDGAGFKEGKTALQWAATYGDIPMAKLLLARGADINWIGPYFHTALHYATLADKADMVKLLLENGAEVSINGDGRSPLHISAVRGNFTITKLLVKHKCELDTRDNFNFTPFTLACLRGHLNIIRFLMENARTDTCFLINDGLHRSAECGHLNVMQYLLNKGADVDSVNSLGETALSIASRGHFMAVQLLLEHKCVLTTVDARGYTPLQHAVLREQVDIATTLVKHGSLVQSRSLSIDSPLQIAFTISNPMLIKCLMDAGCQLGQERWFTPDRALEKLQELDFQCPRPRRFRTEINRQKDLWLWIIQKLRRPQTLLEASRVSIRAQLIVGSKGTSILNRINDLPLPTTMKHYLSLEDILWV